MTRKKRGSVILENAKKRVLGLKAVDQKMDFGDTRNLPNLTQMIQELGSKIDAYNTALLAIDSYQKEIKDLEKSLSDLSERMLIGVAFKYGKDSIQYEMAGGVRKSDRIRKSTVSRLKAGAK